MKCPYCQSPDNRVLESRMHRDGNLIRRRRECVACKKRFTTQETLVPVLPMVIKKDGRREPFSEEKIMNGIKAACQKRPIALARIETLVENLVQWVSGFPDKEISSQDIGLKVMALLKGLDDVAYVRFASVYRTFRDIHEFVETLDISKTSEPLTTREVEC